MKFLLSNRRLVSSSRTGLARSERGRRWECKSFTRNIVPNRPKRLLDRKQSNRRVILNGKIKEKIARLKSEMVKISMEQKSIAEGQKQVQKKYEEIQREREQLWKETEIISQQSMGIRVRLNLMFQLFKARVENDFAKVAQLTQSLRDLTMKPKNGRTLIN